MENPSQEPVSGSLFCLYLWDIFFLSVFLKIFKKIQTTDCMTAGIFLTVFSPFGSKGMEFAVQHLKECNTNTVCSLERKLLIFYALILCFSELWTIGPFLKGHLRQSNAERWVQYLTTTLKKHGTKLKEKGKWFCFLKQKNSEYEQMFIYVGIQEEELQGSATWISRCNFSPFPLRENKMTEELY